jgi:hypothetical protein
MLETGFYLKKLTIEEKPKAQRFRVLFYFIGTKMTNTVCCVGATETKDKSIGPDRRLAQLSWPRGAGRQDLYCNGILKGRAVLAAVAGAAQLPATVNFTAAGI